MVCLGVCVAMQCDADEAWLPDGAQMNNLQLARTSLAATKSSFGQLSEDIPTCPEFDGLDAGRRQHSYLMLPLLFLRSPLLSAVC